jgi:hypothetical protein
MERAYEFFQILARHAALLWSDQGLQTDLLPSLSVKLVNAHSEFMLFVSENMLKRGNGQAVFFGKSSGQFPCLMGGENLAIPICRKFSHARPTLPNRNYVIAVKHA